MPNIAITGCSSRFAQVLLPILEADPTIEHIHGLDLVPPTTSSAKLTFHRRDIRDADLKDTFAGCDTLIHLDAALLNGLRLRRHRRRLNLISPEPRAVHLGSAAHQSGASYGETER